ncbi:hypothetical protein [Catellatospora sp. NPDC049609]|uniref:DUF7455 domain-containing protein n=1 Tax=Catellatospora sp. NPDC049609 TaxID=3155505 RepID=UPI003437E784
MTTQTDTTGTGAASAAAVCVSMLDPADTCDRCGARAYVLAVFGRGAELTFCGHHARAYRAGLAATALAVYDETGWLPRQDQP